MESQARDRWMHGRQQPRFSPYGGEHARQSIDSIRTEGRTRRLYLSIGNTQFGRDSALVVIDPSMRTASVRLGMTTFSRRIQHPGDSASFATNRRAQLGAVEFRIRDLLPSLPPVAPRIGLTWSDTIARDFRDGPYRRALRGTRVSRIIRDSSIDGRRVWIVRDSANVRYDEAYPEREGTLDTTVLISRSATGFIRGVQALDAELLLFRSREDTTRLRGEAVLRYPSGRTLTTPARYERMRRWKLYAPRAYETYLAERRAATARGFGGMVFIPSDSLEERLSNGDVRARDSLMSAWKRTSDPDEAEAISSLLEMWVRDDTSRALLDRVRIAAGDTAFLYEYLTMRAVDPDKPADSADVRAMLRFMQDPSIAWGFNLPRGQIYESLVQGMTRWPSAAKERSEDPVSCTPSACRLLAAQWRTAREQRMRDVGLVALFSMDPRRWADTVLALDAHSHPLLRSAKTLAVGTGATWPASSKKPMPPPNSDARAWLEWTSGGESYVRFEEQHRTALRMYTARTGRDLLGELQRGYRQATSDSTRLVFGTILQHLGALQLSESELAEALISGVRARFDLARGDLASQLGRSTTSLSEEKAAPLIDRLIAAVVSSTPLWRDLDSQNSPGSRTRLPGLHGGSGRIFFEFDNVPASVRAKWAGRVEFMSKSEWNGREPREGGAFYVLQPIVGFGRFAQVVLTLSERIGRSAGAVPEGYAAGSTIYLMELNGEWVIVASEGWIT